MLSLPITLLILLITFGALVAAGVPLLLGLTAVFATFGLLALPSHLLPIADEAPALILLIGLAVGVDYAMFYLKRERQERAAGRSERAALEAAAATSGRSVLISGLTVMAAMAGMFLDGDPTFSSFALATIVVVAIAVLGSLTLLPALLSRLGDNVDRLRVPFVRQAPPQRWRKPDLGHDRRPRPRRPASSWSLPAACWSGSPHLLYNCGSRLRAGIVPAVAAVMQTYSRMQQAFPGSASPRRRRQGADVHAPIVARRSRSSGRGRLRAV